MGPAIWKVQHTKGWHNFVIFKLGLKLEPKNVGQVMQLPEIGIYRNRAHAVLLLLKTQDLWNNNILLSWVVFGLALAPQFKHFHILKFENAGRNGPVNKIVATANFMLELQSSGKRVSDGRGISKEMYLPFLSIHF